MTEADRVTAEKLLRHGLSVPTVASVLELDFDDVLELATNIGTDLPDSSLEDVQDAMTKLSAKVLEETMIMLDESSPTIKTRLLIGMFGKLVGVVTTQKNDTAEQLRASMADMFAEMAAQGPLPAQPAVDEDEDPLDS